MPDRTPDFDGLEELLPTKRLRGFAASLGRLEPDILTKDDGFRQFMSGSRALRFGTRPSRSTTSSTSNTIVAISITLHAYSLGHIAQDDKQKWRW